jgi:DNA-binding CsgD family transcriptional regulator
MATRHEEMFKQYQAGDSLALIASRFNITEVGVRGAIRRVSARTGVPLRTTPSVNFLKRKTSDGARTRKCVARGSALIDPVKNKVFMELLPVWKDKKITQAKFAAELGVTIRTVRNALRRLGEEPRLRGRRFGGEASDFEKFRQAVYDDWMEPMPAREVARKHEITARRVHELVGQVRRKIALDNIREEDRQREEYEKSQDTTPGQDTNPSEDP